jgi:carboxyl-terminal processing protease
MRRPWLVASIVLAGGVIAAGWLLRPHRSGEADVSLEPTRLFEQVMTHVRRYGVDSFPESDLYRRAANGLLGGLEDEYATILRPGQETGLAETADVGGLGMLLSARDGRITVQSVLSGSSAEQAGIASGDVLVEVGNVPLDASRRDQVLAALSGPPGSRAPIRLRRPGVGVLSFELERSAPRQFLVDPAVQWDNQVGYIAVRLLGQGAVKEVRKQIESLLEDDVRGLVLDLRGASQGSLEEGVALADLFLEPGASVMELRGRDPAPRRFGDDAPQDRRLARLAVVVLVDSSTADAAEVTAGALQDNDRALLLGQPTFGRGLSAETFPLADQVIVRISTGRWFTPAGRPIQRDTATSDTLELRPRASTAGGRSVYSGGRIVPDSLTPRRTDAAQLSFARGIGTEVAEWRAVLQSVAAAHSAPVKRGETPVLTPEIRSRLQAGLDSAGVAVPSEFWSAAGPVIEQQVGD